jgi:hypothetical protein
VDRAGEGLIRGGHHRSLAHDQEPPLDERPCNRCSGTSEDPGEGGAGNAHPDSGGFLVETFQVGQSERLELIETKWLDLELVHRTSDRLERPPLGSASDPPELFRSWHHVAS